MLYSSFHYNRMSCCPKRKVSVSCSCGLCSWPLGYPPGAIPKALPGGSAHPTRFSPTEVASARLQAVLWLSSGSGISRTKLPVPDMGRGRQGLGMTTVRPHWCTCQAYEKGAWAPPFRSLGVRRSASGKESTAPVGRPGGGSRGHVVHSLWAGEKLRSHLHRQGAGRSDGLKRRAGETGGKPKCGV